MIGGPQGPLLVSFTPFRFANFLKVFVRAYSEIKLVAKGVMLDGS